MAERLAERTEKQQTFQSQHSRSPTENAQLTAIATVQHLQTVGCGSRPYRTHADQMAEN
jgi:hypothetical protein